MFPSVLIVAPACALRNGTRSLVRVSTAGGINLAVLPVNPPYGFL